MCSISPGLHTWAAVCLTASVVPSSTSEAPLSRWIFSGHPLRPLSLPALAGPDNHNKATGPRPLPLIPLLPSYWSPAAENSSLKWKAKISLQGVEHLGLETVDTAGSGTQPETQRECSILCLWGSRVAQGRESCCFGDSMM